MKALFAFAAAMATIGAGPASTPVAVNWVNTVALAPNGALVMGKPNAKVRLVEYISYSCPHCAHFVGEAAEPLKRDYVAKGLVAVEFRNLVRDRFDFTAALLARCGAPTRFHGNTELLMATQMEWLGKVNDLVKARGAQLSKMPMDDQLKTLVRGLGLDKIMARRGYTPAQLDICVTDKAMQKRLGALTDAAMASGQVKGTPTFVINGTVLDNAGSWAIVEPSLKTALEMN